MNLVRKMIKTAEILVLAGGMAVSTWGAEAEVHTLTLKEAVNRAITSCDKKTVYGSYLQAYDEITKYNRDVFNPVYRQYKLSQKTYAYNQEYINDKIAYDATNTYLSVISLNQQIEMTQNRLAIAEKKAAQIAIRKAKGMASELEEKKGQDELTAIKTSLAALESSLKSKVLDFKNLTNMDITKYTLDTEFVLEPAAVEGAPTSFFDRKLQDFYALKQDAIDIRELGNELDFSGTMTLGEYYLQEANVLSDKYTLKDLKETMSTTLINAYHSLEPLKRQVEQYEIQLDSAEQTLKVQEMRLDKGYISKLAYEEALLTTQQLRCDQINAIKDYLTTKMTVEEPNILAMQ